MEAARSLGIVDARPGEDPQTSAIEQLIDRQLMLAEVARFPPSEPPAAAIAEQMATMKARAGSGLDALVQTTGVDDAGMRALARDNLRIQAYLNQRFGTAAQVGQEEARRFYDAHPDEFRREGVRIPFEQAEPIARERAAAERMRGTIAQWVRDLRSRAEVVVLAR